MKTLYIQCNMGCAGDMLMSALSELLPNKDEFFKKLNEIGLTIIVVTHDQAVADYCSRIITINDGKIIQNKEKNIVSSIYS